MTKNYEDAQIGTGASLEIDSIRTAEAATSITKDTGKYQRMGVNCSLMSCSLYHFLIGLQSVTLNSYKNSNVVYLMKASVSTLSCFVVSGVDPIQEAIMEYNRSRQGRALPPDIFLGLRFADANGQPPNADLHQGVGHFCRFYFDICQ